MAARSRPFANFFAKPLLKFFNKSILASSDAYHISSENLAPYSNLIGTIVIGLSDTPPTPLSPFSATISTSLSNVKSNCVTPLNGIGSCPDSFCKTDSPLTLSIRSGNNSDGKFTPLLDKISAIFTPYSMN